MSDPSHTWSALRPEAWAALVVGLAVLAAAAAAARRARPPWRRVLLAVAALACLRLALFENPLAWQVYARLLSPEGVGWRQHHVVRIREDEFFRTDPARHYLAVGSSQTGRIYHSVGRERDDLGTFVVAGMTPLDLVLYRDAIARRDPECVLLYLSDFDLARPVPATVIATAPRQGVGIVHLAATLRSLPGGEEFRTAVAELALGELSPEAKYGFVLRGLVDEAFSRVADRLAPPERHEAGSNEETRIEWLRESYDERWLEPNLRQIEAFLAYARQRGIEVAIVEGNVRPDARDERMRRLARETREALRAVAARTPGARYFGSEELPPLDDASFDDLTHVHDEVGRRLAHGVLALLEGRPLPLDFNPAAAPAPRDEVWWRKRVREIEARVARAAPGGVALVGDSITEGWEREGAAAWRTAFPGREALNLGVSSDRTEHVLWRLRHLDLERLRPDVAIVMAGTNNAVRPAQTAAEIAGGVEAIVNEIRERCPHADIVTFAILPRGAPDTAPRAKIAEVNRLLAARLSGRGRVRYVDVGAAFVQPDGAVRRDLLPDGLHPSGEGYAVLAAAANARLRAGVAP